MSDHSHEPQPLSGLLWAIRFDESGRGHPSDDIKDIASLGTFGEGFLWLHFDLTQADLGSAIDEGELGPKRLASSAFGPDNHQRMTVDGTFVGGVVADLNRVADGTEEEDVTGRLHFVIGPRFLISGRRQPVESPEAARDAAAQGACFTSPILLLETLIGYVIASIAASGAKLADELDGIEDHILDAQVRGDRRR